MSIFEKHKKEYLKTMIKAWLILAKRHNDVINKINIDTFYWDNFVDVEIQFTNKGKILGYKFIENEV